jgi:hypothetical protein
MTTYFKSKPPQYDNGSMFLGYRVPGGQTFTNFSPPSDMDAYLQALTGLSGWQQRNLLQSKNGTEVLAQAASGKMGEQTSYLGIPAYASKASCQQDADCPSNQICYAFNEQVFGPQQGPTCSPTVYPEILLGNQHNDGMPLRQYSNYCYTDEDCKTVDRWTGKPKVGMQCNHYYKGPNMYSKNGLCQVKYEHNGQNFFLKTPPGWTMPLQSKLQKCNTQSDCGPGGVNGWTRCVGGSDDGQSYCVWPGQTYTPSPKQLIDSIPRGMQREPAPVLAGPTKMQNQVLNLESAHANNPLDQTPGGFLKNVSKPPIKNPNSLIAMSNRSQLINSNEVITNRPAAEPPGKFKAK